MWPYGMDDNFHNMDNILLFPHDSMVKLLLSMLYFKEFR